MPSSHQKRGSLRLRDTDEPVTLVLLSNPIECAQRKPGAGVLTVRPLVVEGNRFYR